MGKFGRESPAEFQLCFNHAIHLAVCEVLYKVLVEESEDVKKIKIVEINRIKSYQKTTLEDLSYSAKLRGQKTSTTYLAATELNHKGSKLAQLSPAIDEIRVIRMQGRIEAANNISITTKRTNAVHK